MDEIMEFEIECDAPENWISDTVLFRNELGEIIELDVPDDIEEG